MAISPLLSGFRNKKYICHTANVPKCQKHDRLVLRDTREWLESVDWTRPVTPKVTVSTMVRHHQYPWEEQKTNVINMSAVGRSHTCAVWPHSLRRMCHLLSGVQVAISGNLCIRNIDSLLCPLYDDDTRCGPCPDTVMDRSSNGGSQAAQSCQQFDSNHSQWYSPFHGHLHERPKCLGQWLWFVYILHVPNEDVFQSASL